MMTDDLNAYKQPRPRLDPTINYGHILTVISFIVAGVGAYFGVRGELVNVDLRVAKIESTLQQLANVVGNAIRQHQNANKVGKDVSIWSSCYLVVEAAMSSTMKQEADKRIQELEAEIETLKRAKRK